MIILISIFSVVCVYVGNELMFDKKNDSNIVIIIIM